tara:strand:- start:3048 stop:4061 length:1014 start_codon:yes stop_codon:yes gene_type:complete
MSRKSDFNSLGKAYGDVLDRLVVTEDTVPVGEVGEAPLVGGGPEEEGGFRPAKVDITKLSDKDKNNNIYNIKGYTYGDGNDPGIGCDEPLPTGNDALIGNVGEEDEEEEECDCEGECGVDPCKKCGKSHHPNPNPEEDEEILSEHEKNARRSLNNFMAKKSVFDKLYNKVMVSEDFEETETFTDTEEIEALGIETDEVPEEVTVSIPGELAQTLSDILTTAIAQQETEVDIDVDITDVTDTEIEENEEDQDEEVPEEDEEAAMKDGGGYGVDAGSTLSKEINYGKKNRVGKLRPAGGPVMKDGGGYGVDAGSTLSKEIDYGKNNKVGNIKLGSIPGA